MTALTGRMHMNT